MNHPTITVEDLHQTLHTAIRDLRSGAEWKRWLDGATVFHDYSFRNVVLIKLQAPESSRVAGYKAWRKLGRRVMRNERAIRILAPLVERKAAKPDQAGQTDEALDAKPARDGGRLIGFRVASVWDISQTEGAPLPRRPQPSPVVGDVPTGLWEALAREAYAAGFTLVERDTDNRGVAGFTKYDTKTIVISNRLDDVAAVSCLAHEVAHMRMHRPEEISAAGSRMCRGIREVEAESVAYILLAHHGLATDGASFPYVAGWAALLNKAEPEKVVETTGTRVLVTARQLIDATDKHMTRPSAKSPLGPAAPVVDLSAFRTNTGHSPAL